MAVSKRSSEAGVARHADLQALAARANALSADAAGSALPVLDNIHTIGDPDDASVLAGLSRFKIRLASTEGRRSSASYLIKKMYGWRGYETSGAIPVTPNQMTLVAGEDARTLGTLTIGFDSEEGLLVDELYRDEIDKLRAGGARLCEFTKLAVERNEHARELLAMMFHIAYMYARRLHGCTAVLIEVNPRHVRFYHAMLGFEIIGPERNCPRVNAPAVLLKLDLAYCEEQIARYGGHRELAGAVRSLYPLGFSRLEEDGICGRLRALN